MAEQEPAKALLRPGETCRRIKRAERLEVIIEAAGYFATVKTAVQRAQRA